MTILHRSLKELSSRPMSPEEVDRQVIGIMSTLGTGYRDWTIASTTYNSDFFKGESHEFKVALCRALVAHFPGYKNQFWQKAVSQ